MAGLFDFLMRAKLSLEPNIDPQALGKMKKGTKKAFNDAFAEASKKGIFSTKQARELFKNFSIAGDAMTEQVKKVAKLQQKIQQETQRGNDTRALKSAMEREKLILQRIQARYAKEEKFIKRMTDRRKAAVEEAGKLAERTMGEAAEEFSEGIGRAFDDIKGFNFADLFKRAGKRTEVRGAGMTQKGAEQGGAMGKMMQGIGGLLTKIGPLLAAVGAIAAGMAAFIKILIDADAKVKEWNRSLVESGVAAGDLASSAATLNDTLSSLHSTFATGDGAFSFNRVWGTTAKDHLEILGAYSEAGLTFRELKTAVGGAKTEMQALRDATEATLTYAKLFGVSNADMAQNMASYMEELGLTLEGVQQRFSAIHMAARESGFGVKRFFNMVLQATTGMSMYNVRIEEASELLIHLGKVLGSKMGGDFLQQLAKGFGDEGMTDRFKRIMTTGTKKTGEIMGKSATNMAEDFQRKLGDLSADQKAKFDEALRAFHIDPSAKPEQLVQQMSKLSAKDQAQLLAKAELSGNADMVRQLRQMSMLSRGAGGGLQGQALALGGLDMGGKLAMQLNQAMAVIGKPIHEMTAIERAGFESITGTTGEAAEQLSALGERFKGRYTELQELSKSIKEGAAWDEGKAAEMGKAFGLYVDKQGVIRKAMFDKQGKLQEGEGTEIKSFTDVLMTQGKDLAKFAKEQVPQDIKLAQEIVRNTTDITKIMEQGIEWLLGKIYEVVAKIWGWISGPTEGERRASAEAQAKMAKDAVAARENIIKLEKELSSLQAQGASEEEIEAKRKEITGANLQKEVARLAEAELPNLPTDDMGLIDRVVTKAGEGLFGWEARTRSPGERKSEALQRLSTEELRSMYERAGMDPKAVVAQHKKVSPEMVQAVYGKQLGLGSNVTAQQIYDLVLSGKAPGAGRYLREGEEFLPDAAGNAAGGTARLFGSEYTRAASGQYELTEKQALLSGMGIIDLSSFKDLLYEGAKSGLMVSDPDYEGGYVEGGKGERLQPLTPEELKRVQEAAQKRALEAERRKTAPTEKSRFDKQVKQVENLPKEIADEQEKRQILAGLRQMFPGKSDVELQGFSEAIAKNELPDAVRDAFKTLPADVQGRVLNAGFGGRAGLLSTSAPAKDFLMHIGEGGQVKFAQRIDSADQVTAVAAKGGGAIDRAGRGSRGGTVNHHHYYNDAKGVYSQWQKLQQARVFG